MQFLNSYYNKTLFKSVKFLNLSIYCLALISPLLINKISSHSVQSPIFFEARQISEYKFESINLGQQQQKSLGTSNISNENFSDVNSNRVSVFKARWTSQEGSGEELYHTPDVCWVLQGFKQISVGEDSWVDLNFHGEIIRFQCRVLHHPDQPTPEVVLWAACVNGRWDTVSYSRAPLPLSSYNGLINYLNGCRLDLSLKRDYIWSRIGNPSTQGAAKKMVRVSKPLSGDWRQTVLEL